jgi:hypothetical protein
MACSLASALRLARARQQLAARSALEQRCESMLLVLLQARALAFPHDYA